MKTALITGITSQDGAYLSKLLLEKGYQVVGTVRNIKESNLDGLEYLKIKNKIVIQECDLSDMPNILGMLEDYKPDEIYNLAAQSSVGLSFHQPFGTIYINTISVLNLLESIKRFDKSIRFYQASSSEMYGKVEKLPVTEETPMHPLSPYAISKATGHWTTVNYREAYGLKASCGILFNHESILRRDNFFVKKLIKESLEIKHGKREKIVLGNIEISRDFGFVPEYVKAMWLMMQNEPGDYIICSGKPVQLKMIVMHVFEVLGINENALVIDPGLFRPSEIKCIYGSSEKAKTKLNWDYNLDFFKVLDTIIEQAEDLYGKSIL